MSTNTPNTQTALDSTPTESPDERTAESPRPTGEEARTTAGAQATFPSTGERLPGLFERQATFCE